MDGMTPDSNPRSLVHRWRRSLSAKLVTLALVSVVCAVAASTAVTIFGQRATMEKDFAAAAGRITGLVANSVGGAIRWGKSDIVMAELDPLVTDETIDISAYAVMHVDGSSVAASDSETTAQLSDLLSAFIAGEEHVVTSTRSGGSLLVVAPGGFDKDGNLQGAVAIEWSLDRLGAEIAAARMQAVLMALLIAVVVGIALRQSFAHMITRPLIGAARKLNALADGDTEFEIEDEMRRDEIGGIARAIKVLKANEIEREELVAEQHATTERRRVRQERIEEVVGVFSESSHEALDGVARVLANLESTANVLGEVATQTDQRASDATGASQSAAEHADTVAAAAEELSASVAEISAQVSQTKDVIARATELANGTNDRVSTLADTAQKIGEVISIIQQIAEQTNLLALNATIEAARAGEFGKGFAVVANEVKQLAGQTAKATDEIISQIRNIQEQSSAAVASISEIDNLMNDVNEMSTGLAASVEEQHAATSEISKSIHSAAQGARSAANNMDELVKSVSQTSASAGEARSVAESVTAEADRLRGSISDFITDIRAA